MPAYGAWPGVAIQKCRTVNCHGNHNLIYACILIYAIYAVFGPFRSGNDNHTSFTLKNTFFFSDNRFQLSTRKTEKKNTITCYLILLLVCFSKDNC